MCKTSSKSAGTAHLDVIVSELQNAQEKALPDPPDPRYPIVAHVERFQPGRQVSPVHRLHPAEKVVADVQVPQGRHGRKHGDIEHLENKAWGTPPSVHLLRMYVCTCTKKER